MAAARTKLEKTRHSGIYKREGKKRTTYYVVEYTGVDDSGKRIQRWHSGYETLKDAKAAQDEIRHRVREGTYVRRSATTVQEWIEEWLLVVQREIRPSTFESYSGTLRRHVVPTLGQTRLQNLTAGMLNKLYASLTEPQTIRGKRRRGLSPQTIRYTHTVLKRALAEAVNADQLGRNPAERATPPKPVAQRVPKTWSAAELRTFLDAVEGDRLAAAWRLLAMTGMRRGELLGLKWAALDLERARVQIAETLIGARETSTPKTDAGERLVELDPKTVAALRTHKAQQAAGRLASGAAYRDAGYVFCREDGSPIWPRSFSRAFDRHVEALGLPRIPLKNLRHSHATLLLANGVPARVIQERLGHSDVVVTLRTYAASTPALHAEATAHAAALVDGS